MSKLSRCLILVLALVLAFTYSFPEGVVYAEGDIVASGTCGNNLTWELDGDGVLTISGTGTMYGWMGGRAPWYSKHESINEIIIAEGVTSIGECAFYGCSILTNITIPEGVTSIGDGAFRGCSNLASISIPQGVKKIETDAFFECSSLIDVTIPDSVTSIGGNAFGRCTSLTNITIPDSVTNIEGGAFDSCINLTKVILPDGLISIGLCAFARCLNLTSIIIPEGVISIGQEAFCNGILSSIFIPETVTTIGPNAFAGSSIVNVYTTPGSYVATYKPSNCTISYLCDPITEEIDINHLGFSSDTIVMKSGRVLNLSDYFISNYSLDGCAVNLSNEDDFVYDAGKVANLVAGECDVTVTKDDLSATVKIIAQDEDPANIESIALHDESLSMMKGEMVVNSATLNPINADNTDISWSSSDESVATVSNGLITAVGTGTATITVYSTSDPDIKAECQVTVTTPLYDIIPLEDPMVMDKGTSRKVPFYRYHYGATDEISFASADPEIASIDENGRVTANNIGTTTVTISSGDIVKTVEVRVKKALKGISLDKTSATLYNGDSLQLNVIFDPEDTTETDVTWSSSNEAVATVDENGLVTAHGTGIVEITATAGNYSATCNVVCPRVALTGIELPATLELEYGQGHTMEVTGVPANTTDDLTATWISRDESILTVDGNGVITPQGIGTTKVVAMVGDFAATTDVTIVKGRPNYVVPTGITAICKQTLSEVSLPNGFTWKDGTIDVGTAGSKEYSVVFTPEDTEHYVIVNDIPVTVEVVHKFDTAWLSDGIHHWHVCACGEINSLGDHVYSDWAVVTDATCTEDGSSEKVCSVCNYKVTETIPALGHDWDSENIVWRWAEDYSSAEATFTCKRDPSHTKTVEATVSSETVSGIITYTAHATFEGATYTDIRTVDAHAIIRLSGSNRFLTAIDAANHLKEKKGIPAFDSIIVASGSGFPDALSASYLAYRKDAPILLIHSSVMPMVTDYINSNLAPGGTVYIVGGEGVVSPEVAQLIDGKVVRLSGKDRYETNMEVLKEAGLEFNDSENVLVACGTNFADALSASAVGEPILLVGKELNAKQEAFLKSFLPGDGEAGFQSYEFSIIGGPGAVPEKVEDQLKTLGTVERVYGTNRYQTSVAVAERFFKGNQDTVVIANGNNFPDGLSGGPVATMYEAPLILLVDKVSDHAVKYFKEKGAYRLVIMGGEGVISNETAEKVFGGKI